MKANNIIDVSLDSPSWLKTFGWSKIHAEVQIKFMLKLINALSKIFKIEKLTSLICLYQSKSMLCSTAHV